MQSKFFRTRKLLDNVTLISGLGGEQCYLIEGSEKALLIDGLAGVGSLKAFVRELTDLPVELALTHNHVDHIGAAFEYGSAYIHPDDMARFYEEGEEKKRFDYATSGGTVLFPFALRFEDTIPRVPVRLLPIREGDVFDLGGVRLEVIEVPGHSWGSVVFLDRAARILYTGDAVNRNTLLVLNGTSVEQYRESLLHLQTFADAFDVCWGGHGGESVPRTVVDEAVLLCDEILAGTDERVPSSFRDIPTLYARKKDPMFRRLDGGIANIAYTTDCIWKSQVQRPDLP